MMSSFRPEARFEASGFVPESDGESAFGFLPVSLGRSASSSLSSSPDAEGEPERTDSADRILTEAEIAALEAEAFNRGVASERAEARAGAEAMQHACDALTGAAHAWSNQIEAIRLGGPQEVAGLALEIARRWVGDVFEAEPGRFISVVEEALSLCGDHGPEKVMLNPKDLRTIESIDSEQLGEWKQTRNLELISADSIGRGEFRIEAARGVLDGGFEAVAARLRDVLLRDPVETAAEAEGETL